MRLKLLTNLNTLLLVAVCLALGATLWWSQQALERPFLLMERYLSLSQQFQNNVARNIEDYLASGDALRLSDANSALDTIKSQLAPLPPASMLGTNLLVRAWSRGTAQKYPLILRAPGRPECPPGHLCALL